MPVEQLISEDVAGADQEFLYTLNFGPQRDPRVENERQSHGGTRNDTDSERDLIRIIRVHPW